MKIEIITIDGVSKGWTITAESNEDNKTLNVIRDLSFWGMDDTKIIYAGMTSDESENNVQSLRWIQKGEADKKNKALDQEYDRLMKQYTKQQGE